MAFAHKGCTATLPWSLIAYQIRIWIHDPVSQFLKINLSDVLGKMHEQFLKAPYLCELPCSLHWAVGAPPVFSKGCLHQRRQDSWKEVRIVQSPTPSDCCFASQMLQIIFQVKSLAYLLQLYHILPFAKPFQNF